MGEEDVLVTIGVKVPEGSLDEYEETELRVKIDPEVPADLERFTLQYKALMAHLCIRNEELPNGYAMQLKVECSRNMHEKLDPNLLNQPGVDVVKKAKVGEMPLGEHVKSAPMDKPNLE